MKTSVDDDMLAAALIAIQLYVEQAEQSAPIATPPSAWGVAARREAHGMLAVRNGAGETWGNADRAAWETKR